MANPNQMIVATSGDLFVAPTGIELPATCDDVFGDGVPVEPWVNLGCLSEDGATFTTTPEIEEFFCWQEQDPVRRAVTRRETTLAGSLQEWNCTSVPLAFGGGQVVDLGDGCFRYDFPKGDDCLDERALILRWADAGAECGPGQEQRHFALVVERANITEAVEVQLTRSEMAVLPITFSVLAPGFGQDDPYDPDADRSGVYLLTDDADGFGDCPTGS